MCKNTFLTALLLFVNSEILFARTGSSSDDFLIVIVPFTMLAIALVVYEVKAKLKSRKEAAANLNTEENSSVGEQ